MNSDVLDLTMRLSVAEMDLVEFHKLFFRLENAVEFAWFHHQWSKDLLQGTDNLVIQGFRESAKTNIAINAHTLHRMVFPTKPYSYIVFIVANATMATKRITEIVNRFRERQDVAGNLVSETTYTPSLGVYEAIVTDGREEFPIRIEAYGKGMSIRGLAWNDRRPQLVVIDDPQDLEDAQSETVLASDWDWFLSEVLFLGKDTRIILIGNNLGEKSIVERVMAQAGELGFSASRIPIMTDDEQPNWAARYPMQFIRQEKAKYVTLGKLDIWYRERMCKTTDPSSQWFPKSQFRYYDPRMTRKIVARSNVFITLDPALGRATSDYTSLCVVAVSPENCWYIVDIDYGRYGPIDTIERLFSLVLAWRPRCVGVESIAYQASLQDFMERDMLTRNIFFRIEPIADRRQKELKIEALRPRMATGSIWFPSGASFLPELEAEMLAYPAFPAHDDVIESLAMVDRIAFPPMGGWGYADEDKMPEAGSL